MISHVRNIAALLLSSYLVACSTQAANPVETNPKADINALVTNSLVYAQRGSLDKTQRTINKVLTIDPNSVDANNIAGLIYGKANQPGLTVGHFEKALSGTRNDASTLNNYGNFLCDHGDTKDAEKKFLQAAAYFKTALDYKDNNSIALFHLAQINLAKKRSIPTLGRLHAYSQFSKHTPKTLRLGIEIRHLLRDKEVAYLNLLQNEFPTSEEFQRATATMQ